VDQFERKFPINGYRKKKGKLFSWKTSGCPSDIKYVQRHERGKLRPCQEQRKEGEGTTISCWAKASGKNLLSLGGGFRRG